MPLSSTAEIAKKAWKTLWIRFDYRVHNPYLITPKPGLRIKGTPTPSASPIAAIHDAAVYQHSYPASSAPIVPRVVTAAHRLCHTETIDTTTILLEPVAARHHPFG